MGGRECASSVDRWMDGAWSMEESGSWCVSDEAVHLPVRLPVCLPRLPHITADSHESEDDK